MADDLLSGLDGDALALAVRAAAAAHVDAGLLRHLRLRFLTRSDASLEATVWRSGIVESETNNGLTFSTAALTELRSQLASRFSQRGDMKISWVDETCDEIAAYHAGGPPLVLLEERLVRFALLGESQKINEELGKVLLALERQASTRGATILHWANHALPRLPPVVQSTAAAWALALAAQRHFDREILPGAPPAELATFDLTSYLPERDVPLTVRYEDGYLVFGSGIADGQQIDVPDTQPRVVVLDRDGARTVIRVGHGEEVKVENTVYPVELRDLRGRRWRVRELEEAAEAEPTSIRFLVFSDLQLTPDSIDEVEQRIEMIRSKVSLDPSPGKYHLDTILFLRDLLDERFLHDDDFVGRVSSWVHRFSYRIGQRARQTHRPEDSRLTMHIGECEIGVVLLHHTHADIAGQIATVFGDDLPALFREQVDAALLFVETDTHGREDLNEQGPQDALSSFDAKITDAMVGFKSVPGDFLIAPSWCRAPDQLGSALLLELIIDQRRSSLIRSSLLDQEGRVVHSAERKIEREPRRLGRRAAVRREIIRHLRAGRSVLLSGAQTSGKMELIAELIDGPWLTMSKAASVEEARHSNEAVQAISTELDPGVDMDVLQEACTIPLLLESPVLPFREPPEMDPSWRLVTLERLERADVLDALTHVDVRMRDSIATWLLEETGGDPWLVWRAIAGARLRGAGDVNSYIEPLAQAAAQSLTEIGDPAAIELLAALRAGPRWPVDRCAQWQLEHHGVGHMKDGLFALCSPVVGRVITDDLIDRLRAVTLGKLADHLERWVRIDAEIPGPWVGPVAMAIARSGFGLEEHGGRPGPVSRLLETLRRHEWLRIGGSAEVTIHIGEQTAGPKGVIGLPESLGPDQLYVWLSEALDAQAGPGRSLSVLLEQLGVHDPAFVTVRSDIARKAARHTQIAEVVGVRQIRISDAEARRLYRAGARSHRRRPEPAAQTAVESVEEIGEVDDE